MPPSSRRFISLPVQVADALRQGIGQGAWKEWLPGERALGETFQVSRKTLRKALAQLREEGIVRAEHGLGNRIVAPGAGRARKADAERIVALLTPDPIEHMRPHTLLWINRLKSLLIENGAKLLAFDGHKYFGRQPGNALKKLVAQQSASCWLLANSTKTAQRWFCERKLPCVVAGSCHTGIDLPYVDLDHYALCRHAAGVLLAAGHVRVALLNGCSGRAGDMESEAGFVAGVRESRRTAAAPPLVLYHDHSATSLARAVTRLLDMPDPPTAVLVSNSASYLTVVSVLAQRGLRVPADMSVVSRDDEPFLSFLLPTPSRYTANPHVFAKKILKPLKQILHGESVSPRSTRIIPDYNKGGSLRVVK
ncbi:MAG: substrate-binding domain-containing protein [Opitutaceae bacterium]|jgi:LacI family transcriptional regulator|nr:substrate-binding domain-containing protein [Opitutaceae bacterium]